MSLKRRIKWLQSFFLVGLLAAGALAGHLFYRELDHYHRYVHEKSLAHLEVLAALAQAEAALARHQKALPCAATTGDDRCLSVLRGARDTVMERLGSLEELNRRRFPRWVVVKEFSAPDPEGDLRRHLDELKASDSKVPDETTLQPVFYLLRAALLGYFQSAKFRVSQGLSAPVDGATAPPNLAAEDNLLDLVYRGFDGVREQYNRLFWDENTRENRGFLRQGRNAVLFLGAAIVVLAGLSAWIIGLTRRHFRREELRDENLVLLGTRDLATGLFNRASFEALLVQEMRRSQRRNYPLCLFLVRVESFDKIGSGLGEIALNRLFFQIGELLKTSCRAYDAVFRMDEKSFAVLLPETNPRHAPAFAARLKGQLERRRFPVKGDQTKVTPPFVVGGAVFPGCGNDVKELLDFAEKSLSPNFDGKLLAKYAPPEPAPAAPPAAGTAESRTPEVPEVVRALESVPASAEGQGDDIRVVKSGGEDVIMVDLDHEREDVAEKFRRRKKKGGGS